MKTFTTIQRLHQAEGCLLINNNGNFQYHMLMLQSKHVGFDQEQITQRELSIRKISTDAEKWHFVYFLHLEVIYYTRWS